MELSGCILCYMGKFEIGIPQIFCLFMKLRMESIFTCSIVSSYPSLHPSSQLGECSCMPFSKPHVIYSTTCLSLSQVNNIDQCWCGGPVSQPACKDTQKRTNFRMKTMDFFQKIITDYKSAAMQQVKPKDNGLLCPPKYELHCLLIILQL